MSKPEEDWPEAEVGQLPEDDLEVKNEKAIFNMTISDKLYELLMRYSSWAALQRTVTWLLKFKAYLQCPKGSNINSGAKYLTTKDLEKATIAIIKLVQSEVYQEEIGDLEKRGNVKRSSGIVKPRPMLVEGVVRVGGCISDCFINAEVGDLVLLVDELLARGQWGMGRVVKVVPGKDGLVRTVEVKTGVSTSLVRPIQKLFFIRGIEKSLP